MSTFKTQQSGSFRFNLRYSRVECTMASHPPGTLTPNWRGERYLAAERATLRIAILWTILRIIPPIAIGLKSVSPFFNAITMAELRNCADSRGSFPTSHTLMKRRNAPLKEIGRASCRERVCQYV